MPADWTAIAKAIGDAADHPFSVSKATPIGGGCIHGAHCLSDGQRRFFVKTNQSDFLRSFQLEAEALSEIAATQTLRAPAIICVGSHINTAYLILEYIEPGPPTASSWEHLGRQLAAMHQCHGNAHGWRHDNAIGSTPQANAPCEDWTSFFRDRRLAPMLERCRAAGFHFPKANALLENLDRILAGHQPAASLLHGDLWSGNVAFDRAGAPFIFDPALYYGDRETDLAFTEFFGGFDRRFYSAYHEALPLDSEYKIRKDLYNLYHCLNHCLIFGSSYASQANTLIARLA